MGGLGQPRVEHSLKKMFYITVSVCTVCKILGIAAVEE